MTPSLLTICQDLPLDRPLQLQAGGSGLWGIIGHAVLGALSADAFALQGEADGLPFRLTVARHDETHAALCWQGATAEDARWFAYGEGLVITATLLGSAVELCIWPGDGGVYVSVAGVASAYLWLAPA